MIRFVRNPVGLLSLAAVLIGLIAVVLLGGDDTGSRANQDESANVEVLDIQTPGPTGRTVVVSSYRGALLPDEQPSGWVPQFPTIALIKFEKADVPRWNMSDGAVSFIYTPWQVKVEEYIKGTGPEDRTVVVLGGTVGDTHMVFAEGVEVAFGQRAVVFMTGTGKGMAGATVDNAYVIYGDFARSDLDDRTLAVDELLMQLREAAEADASSQ